MTKLRLRQLAFLVALVLLLARCGSPAAASPDYWPTDGWQNSAPEEQGMASEMLADMLNTIRVQGHNIDSVTVVRNGYLVLDAYVAPFDGNSRHTIYSCTKSIVSALVGIALERGYIESVDQPVQDIFGGRTIANLDADKQAMTLKHLLTMSTGFKCEDSYLYRWRGLNEMRRSDDWVQYVLDLPMAQKPGSQFEYCNGASFLLSAAVQEATGQSAMAFAQEQLFGPLGISDVAWSSNPQGISIGYSELYLRPRDMAKIGHLYLNNGVWEGKQVVPSTWVEASSQNHIAATLQDGYGYQWWVDDSGYYMALGYAGQFIFVLPDENMVVVFTSDLEEKDFYTPQRLLEDYILAAAKSSSPLPADPAGLERLDGAVRALATLEEGAP